MSVGQAHGLGDSLRFQPDIECIDPVVAAGALLSQTEAMAAGTENVDFWFVARRGERVIKLDHGLARLGVILRPSEKHGLQLGRNGRHDSKGTAIDHRSEARTRRGVLLQRSAQGVHRVGGGADLVGYVGHDGLMDFHLPETP